MADESTPLQPRQRAFVDEYIVDLNGAQAAIRAGYSPATAASIASELLTNPNVAAAVDRAKAERLVRVNISADTVLAEMGALALSNVKHYKISDEGQVELADGAPSNAMAAVQSIKKKTRILKDGSREYDVELRLWDKPNPLKLMGKHANVAACFDKMELSGPNGGPIPIDVVRSVVVDPKEIP